jgi:hypothetical protein
MSTRKNSKTATRLVQCMVVAAVLAVPSLGAFAAPMDAVTVNPDQRVAHPGRDSVYAPTPEIAATPPDNPQTYGRAGGYVGADRAAVVESAAPHSSTVVKTGESEVEHIARAQNYPQEEMQSVTAQPSQTGTAHEGDRFGDPNGVHGQGQAVQ